MTQDAAVITVLLGVVVWYRTRTYRGGKYQGRG